MLIRLVDVRTKDALYIHASKDGSDVDVRVMTEEIETAADVVQDLVFGFLQKTELKSICCFSRVTDCLDDILETIEQSNLQKTMFAANISENISQVKTFIVRAEASLMIDDIGGMKKNYAEVNS